MENSADYTDIDIMDDYVILSGLYNNGNDSLNALIEVYNKNMELKQTININSDFVNDDPLYSSGNGMAIAKGVYVSDNGFVASGLLNDNTSFLAEYKLLYDITAKTDDNGTIEVVSQALSGDTITFNVRAKTGYKLSSLSVKNSALEKVIFTEDELVLNDDGTFSLSRNSFKMPSSDVEISATFELIVENPDTSDTIMRSIANLIINTFVIIGAIYYRKKYA